MGTDENMHDGERKMLYDLLEDDEHLETISKQDWSEREKT